MKLTDSPFPPGARVVAYLRDSGHEEQDLSIPQQAEAARAWCDEHQLSLAAVYSDSVSGATTTGRKAFLEMIHGLHQASGLAGVLIWRSNRFGRNINDSQYYKADLRRRGYLIHSLTDNIPEGSAGAIVEFALDWKDQVYIEQLSEDVKRGLKYIVETYGAVPGTPPRGFVRQVFEVGTRRDGSPHRLARWVPDQAVTPLVKQAFEMRARGAELREITRVTGLYKSKNCWKTFFENRLYLGELHFGGLVIPHYCEPIVEQTTWEAAQALTRARAWLHGGDHPRRSGSSYPLSGLVFCQECGAALSIHAIQGREYYDCSNKMRTHQCDARAIPRAPLEQIFVTTLREKVFQLEHLEQIQQNLLEHYQSGQTETAARMSALRIREQRARLDLKHTIEAIKAAGHSTALLESLNATEQELSIVTSGIQTLTEQLTPPKPYTSAQLQTITADLLADLEQTPADLRAFLRGFIVRIIAIRTEHEIKGLIEYLPPHLKTKTPPPGGISGKQGSAPGGEQTIYHIHFTIQFMGRKKRGR